ncbi:MAG: lipopolysaccharide biosynthesis protein [Betaproteobacteria bacterium]
MTAAARTIAAQGLKKRALSLGAVKAFDHALQFLLPVVLVRCLDAATFGEYRLLWLAVGTVMAFATLNMTGSLYFFLPRSEPRRRRLFVHHTMLYLAAAGLLCGLALSSWNPLLPAAVRPLEGYGALVPAFVGLWVLAVLLDYLPTIDEQIGWQAAATLSISVLRAALVGAGAWLTADLEVVLWLLLATAAAKLVLLLAYVCRQHGLGRPWLERAAFSEHFRHAAPFGVSSALFNLRAQADQWVAATLFAITSFAAFSIAAIVTQVVSVFRHAVLEAFLPSMSRMHAGGDLRGMMDMNARANVMVAKALFPLLAFAFAFAEDIVAFVYTAAYVEAAPAMRVYIVGMAALVIEVGSVILLLRQGPFAVRLGALLLAASAAASWAGAHGLGLAGAAAGSVAAIYLDRALTLRRIARLTGVSLRRLQDWRWLGGLLVLAAAAALAAWLAAGELSAAPLPRLAAGAVVLAAVYGLPVLWLRR